MKKKLLNIAEEHFLASIEIWKKYAVTKKLSHVPLVIPERGLPDCLLSEVDLLFVGFNPSFSDKYHKRIFQQIPELKNSSFTHDSLFEWSGNISEDQYRVLKCYEEYAFRNYSFFQHFKDLSNFNNYSHLDPFIMRHTNQAAAKELIFKKGTDLNEFGQVQFDLFTRTIKKIKPKIIVVCNALTSKILSKELFQKNEINSSMDVWVDGIKIIYGSMVTGQRAMDLGSRARLKEQIINLINK
jgi:hypothetical protein